jgi:hypothetical protein
MRPDARAVLATAPTPAAAAALTAAQLRALLRKAGRTRGIDAARLRDALRAPRMRQLPLVEQAMGRQTLALLGQLDAACAAAGAAGQPGGWDFRLHATRFGAPSPAGFTLAELAHGGFPHLKGRAAGQ